MGKSVLFRSKAKDSLSSYTVLAVDVGGTKTNLALFRYEDNRLSLIREKTSVTKQFAGAINCLKDFLGDDQPDRICLGVAGPVQDSRVLLTNVSWEIDANRLSAALDNIPVFLINDLEATAYGLMGLEEKDLEVLNPGAPGSKGNIGIIAPGTGLGEAGLFWDGTYHHPFATEGGHCDFSPRTTTHMQLYSHLHQQLGGHVSWERVVSGMGIVNIYEFLRDRKEMEEPAWLAEKMASMDRAAAVSLHAGDCAICSETMSLFFTFLAAESANMALKFKATGGVYIGGGIIRKNMQHLHRNTFMKEFCSSGRLNPLLKDIPITIILNDKTALLGAACYALLQE
ncbi:MAG TPA: glucokinase [Sphingobacteriaceae bacterium]